MKHSLKKLFLFVWGIFLLFSCIRFSFINLSEALCFFSFVRLFVLLSFRFFAALIRVELEDAYGGDGMAVLDCRGRVHLNQVYLCLEPNKDTGLPGEQVINPVILRCEIPTNTWWYAFKMMEIEAEM